MLRKRRQAGTHSKRFARSASANQVARNFYCQTRETLSRRYAVEWEARAPSRAVFRALAKHIVRVSSTHRLVNTVAGLADRRGRRSEHARERVLPKPTASVRLSSSTKKKKPARHERKAGLHTADYRSALPAPVYCCSVTPATLAAR